MDIDATAADGTAALTTTAEETALQCATDHDLRVAYYCEENVWRLAYRMRHSPNHSPGDRFWVVFISNAIKNVPMFQQRANNQDPDKAVCWDYHVILIGHSEAMSSSSSSSSNADDGSSATTMMVYDIDTRLPYPCPLQQYLQQSFPYEWPEPYNPMFRVVPADRFLSYFSSDRSHMINSEGQWNAPPPPYAPIAGGASANTNTSSSNNNLKHYLNFVGRPQRTDEIDEAALGQILSKQQLATADFARE